MVHMSTTTGSVVEHGYVERSDEFGVGNNDLAAEMPRRVAIRDGRIVSDSGRAVPAGAAADKIGRAHV